MKLSPNFFRMKFYFALIIIFILSSCYDKTEKDNCLNQVEFFFILRKSIPLKYAGGINYQKFSFYRNEMPCLKDTLNSKITSLDIIIPDNYTSFSLKGKLKCKCVYTYKKSNNNFVSDSIQTGIAQGILVDKNLWKVVVKIKDFDFEGIISSNEKYNGFRVSSPAGARCTVNK